MKNLILVSLDTVRADVAYNGTFKTIEKFRKAGVTFLNCISSSPFTPASHATVFTGLQPYHHGIRHLFKEKISAKTPTITQILKEKGYRTGAVVSCPGMNKWYGFSRGFDYYDDEIPKLADGTDPLKTVDVKKRGTALKRASIVIERAKAWMKKGDARPYFLFVHFFDAHWPYEAPETYGGKNSYEEEVAFSDHYLGMLFKSLEADGALKNTTIMVVSDHGEDLEGWYPNDKGGKKLGHPEEFGHGCLLYDQTQKTVCIIKDDSLPKGVNISQQVRLVDAFPTILELLKIKNPQSVDGSSLVPIVKKQKDLHLVAYSETFYPEEQFLASGKFKDAKNKISLRIANNFKYIFHLNSNIVELYDLKQDPNELHNMYISPTLPRKKGK